MSRGGGGGGGGDQIHYDNGFITCLHYSREGGTSSSIEAYYNSVLFY